MVALSAGFCTQLRALASRDIMERFLKDKNAQLWIGHSTTFFKNAIKSPGWYD